MCAAGCGADIRHGSDMKNVNDTMLSRLYLKDTAFQDLMQKRIFNILLIATPYDAFILEEDGRVEEQVYNEYVALNLTPRWGRSRSTSSSIRTCSTGGRT